MPAKGLDRRAFLKNAGLTALAGAVSSGTAGATAPAPLSFTPAAAGSKFDFDTIYNRVGTDCTKWDKQIGIFGAENVRVGMGIADLDFKAAPCITRALAERCQHENWGYMPTPPKTYIEAIVGWSKRRYDLEIDPETLVLTDGVHPGLVAALRTFSPPGSKVLLMTPAYSGFYTDIRDTRTLPEDCPMTLKDGRYTIDFDDLASHISADTHTLILCNPQNPTGNCWSKEDLMRLGRLCLERRVVVLADEIHCDFVMKGQTYTPFASLPDADVVRNSLTFKAASKTFSLAAMRSAWFFSTNPDYLARVSANHQAQINTLGVVANRAALNEGEEWLDELLPYIDANHELVESYVREKMPLVRYAKAQGTYLAWLDVSQLVDRLGVKEKAAAATSKQDPSAPAITPEGFLEKWFVDNAGVHLNPGDKYGTGGAGHMRMNIGTSRKLVQLALDGMAAALAKV